MRFWDFALGPQFNQVVAISTSFVSEFCTEKSQPCIVLSRAPGFWMFCLSSGRQPNPGGMRLCRHDRQYQSRLSVAHTSTYQPQDGILIWDLGNRCWQRSHGVLPEHLSEISSFLFTNLYDRIGSVPLPFFALTNLNCCCCDADTLGFDCCQCVDRVDCFRSFLANSFECKGRERWTKDISRGPRGKPKEPEPQP